MHFDQGPSHCKLFSDKRGGELEETAFVDDKLPFVSGEIDLCPLIRLLLENITNYHRPHECGCFLTDSCDNILQIVQLIDVTTLLIQS